MKEFLFSLPFQMEAVRRYFSQSRALSEVYFTQNYYLFLTLGTVTKH